MQRIGGTEERNNTSATKIIEEISNERSKDMSEEGNPVLNFLVGLILGALVGAVYALLYAPESGDELRKKIQSSAEANWQKANLEIERVKQTIQEKTQQSSPQEETPAL